uniref:Putative secreted protein n=1 Tax=Anopheles marajoara TaxID=58244 RepID=A0A2M4C0C9_9DIPT
MVRRLLAILVVLAAGTVWEPSSAAVVSATLATNDVHFPEDSSAQRQPHSKATATTPVTYEFEHGQSELAARRFLATLTDEDIERVESWCLSVPCNASVLHYCRSNVFINDHCCCEQHHTKEHLQWIPHTCLLRPGKRCTANAGSCSNYRTIKACCCDRVTKREFKQKFSSAVSNGPLHFWKLLLLVGVLITAMDYFIM